jgi:hypothetical protein
MKMLSVTVLFSLLIFSSGFQFFDPEKNDEDSCLKCKNLFGGLKPFVKIWCSQERVEDFLEMMKVSTYKVTQQLLS